MATVLEIKQSILDLSATEYAEIIEWLYEREEAEWDRQIEADAATGKLDFLKAQAMDANKTAPWSTRNPPGLQCIEPRRNSGNALRDSLNRCKARRGGTIGC